MKQDKLLVSSNSLFTNGVFTCCALAIPFNGVNMLAHVDGSSAPGMIRFAISETYDVDILKADSNLNIYVFHNSCDSYLSINQVITALELLGLLEKIKFIKIQNDFMSAYVGISILGPFSGINLDPELQNPDRSTSKQYSICKHESRSLQWEPFTPFTPAIPDVMIPSFFPKTGSCKAEACRRWYGNDPDHDPNAGGIGLTPTIPVSV